MMDLLNAFHFSLVLIWPEGKRHHVRYLSVYRLWQSSHREGSGYVRPARR
jgi:hypothetical protein